MSIPSQQPDASTLEQLIFQVRGIQAARVVTAADGVIDEVHVVGLPGRSAKQIVRDIESILYVQGGVRLDHRKVSLVQLDEGGAHRSPPRLLLLGVDYALGRFPPEVTVILGLGERQVQGVGVLGQGEEFTSLMLTARATVSAITQLIGPVAELRVEQIALQAFGDLRVCLSHLAMTTDTGLETLLGISLVRDDELLAASRAVLDAVNRPLLRLLAARA